MTDPNRSMGDALLVSCVHHDDTPPAYTAVTFNIPRADGETWDRLELRQRDAVYQAVLEAIRGK